MGEKTAKEQFIAWCQDPSLSEAGKGRGSPFPAQQDNLWAFRLTHWDIIINGS